MPLPLIMLAILALALGIALGWLARGAVRKDEAARAAFLARHDQREARRKVEREMSKAGVEGANERGRRTRWDKTAKKPRISGILNE